MPYRTKQQLPQQVSEHLPKHAQEIYMKSFNNAWDQYADPDKRRGSQSREEVAHKVAWNAVNQQYEKGDDGDWHRK